MKLNRKQLAAFLPNPEAIRAFEELLGAVGTALPTSVEQVGMVADGAAAQAAAALTQLAEVAHLLALALTAPVEAAPVASPDYSPPCAPLPLDMSELYVPPSAGAPGLEDPANVRITGGTIDGTIIGATAPDAGRFTTLDAGQTARFNTVAGSTLIGTTFMSTGNGKLQVREGANEYIIAVKNAASKEWVWGAVAGKMYFRNATDVVNALHLTDNGRVIVGPGTDDGATRLQVNGGGIKHGSNTLLSTSVALSNGAGAAAGTLANAPTAGNPTKWIPINDNGTTRYIPAW